ncbi:hypothetical protein [Treponema saccharophilum]
MSEAEEADSRMAALSHLISIGGGGCGFKRIGAGEVMKKRLRDEK